MNGLLKAEFIKLKNENIISEETFSKIIEYYEKKEIYELGLVHDAKETLASVIKENEPNVSKNKTSETVVVPAQKIVSQPKKEKKPVNITMLLSIVASLLIGGGIISLIAYNWNVISRFAKSIAAFIICNAAPLLYVILTKFRKKNFEQKSKEFFALLWALLFGGSIAFISQTYKMPSNTVSFLVIWITVSIGITFSLRSFATFFFSLFLLIIYPVYAQQFAYSTAVAFYPAMFFLYFFAKENKKCFYIWIVELIALIGVVFERRLPGLWIIAYVSADVLLINYAEKKEDKFCKRAGIFLAIVLGILLANPYFWKNIGFIYYRNNPKYKMYGAICDYIVTLILYAGSLITVVPALLKKIKKHECQNFTNKFIEFLFLLATGIFYFVASFVGEFAIYITRVFLVIYLTIFMLFILSDKIKKSALCLFAVFYVILLGRINFAFIYIFAGTVIVEYLLRKHKVNEYENKIPVAAGFIFLICERIYYAFSENIFRFQIENSQTLTFDACLASIFLASVICLISFVDFKAKFWNKQTIISKITYYSSIILLSIIHILFEYCDFNFEILFNISFIILAIMSAADFVLNKSKISFLGMSAFVVNFFISSGSAFSFSFFLAVLYLILFALDYYSKQLVTKHEYVRYGYFSVYFLTIVISYVLKINDIIEPVKFNPFESVISGMLYLILILLTFVIPLVSIIKNRSLCRVSPIAIAGLSLLFLTFSRFVKIFNPEIFISVICFVNLIAGCIDIILLKKKETLISVIASFFVYFIQVTNESNYINGIAVAVMAVYAFYVYARFYTEDENVINSVTVLLYTLILFVMLCIEGEGELLNNGKALFSSAESIISTILVLPALIGIPTYIIISRKKEIAISHITITAVFLLYFLFSSYFEIFNPEKLTIVLCLLVVVSSSIDIFVFKKKRNVGLFIISLFKFYKLLLQDYHEEFFVCVFPLVLFAFLIYAKYFIGEKKIINKLVTFIFSVMLIINMEYNLYYSSYSRMELNNVELWLSICVIISVLFVIPLLLLYIRKFKINYVMIPYCLLLIISFLVLIIYKKNVSDIFKRVYEIITMILIFAFAIFGLYSSYLKVSIKSANYYLFFLCICFVIRFFMMSRQLVERGVVCIACGICILIMNLIFSKKMKQQETEQINEKNNKQGGEK